MSNYHQDPRLQQRYPDQRSLPPRAPPIRPGHQMHQSSQRFPVNPTSSRQALPSQQRQQPIQQSRPQNAAPRPAVSPRSQWPLVNDQDFQAGQDRPQQRGPAPQRPARPNQIPVVLPSPRTTNNRGRDGTQTIPQYAENLSPRMDQHVPEPGVWSEDGYSSLKPPRPLTVSSVSSTSSAYSVPEDAPPVPQQPSAAVVQARARAPLGPPPSARRGPPSYYPQQGQPYVTPIVEESDSQRGSSRGAMGSRSSYASSNAIPIGVPDYYLTEAGTPGYDPIYRDSEYRSSEDHLPIQPPPALVHAPAQEEPGLVRQASIGKRSKPTLTTIKPNDSARQSHSRNASQGSVTEAVVNEPEQNLGYATSTRRVSSSVLGKEMLFYDDRSSSDSERSDLQKYRFKDYLTEPMPEKVPEYAIPEKQDPRVEDLLRRLEKGDALPLDIREKSMDAKPQSSLSQRIGSRRPARLNVDAVRDAEARGSLTSLSDLIKRATKLASNLDRGRTASRLGMDWMVSEEAGATAPSEKRRSGSLSDMLSAFPPPVLGTPGSGRFRWPSPGQFRHSALPSESDRGEERRRRQERNKRVCGMRPWIFYLILLLIFLLVVAAVLVPIFLVVLPHDSNASKRSTGCEKEITCSNGGVNIVGATGACQCLCVNGFTGSTCETSSSSSCTTSTVNGTKDATIGTALPRLFDASQTNYSISLDAQTILGMFSATNLSCSEENALVTFDSLSERSVVPTRTFVRRGASSASSDGIAYATGTPTSTSSSTSASSTGSVSASSTNLDFARIAVLLVLQETGELNDAVEAQDSFIDYFTGTSTGDSASNITLQNGYFADLNNLTLTLPNGTTTGNT